MQGNAVESVPFAPQWAALGDPAEAADELAEPFGYELSCGDCSVNRALREVGG